MKEQIKRRILPRQFNTLDLNIQDVEFIDIFQAIRSVIIKPSVEPGSTSLTTTTIRYPTSDLSWLLLPMVFRAKNNYVNHVKMSYFFVIVCNMTEMISL